MVDRFDINITYAADLGSMDMRSRDIARRLDQGTLPEDELREVGADLASLQRQAERVLTRRTDQHVQATVTPLLEEIQTHHRKLGEQTIDRAVDKLTEDAEKSLENTCFFPNCR